MYCIVLFFLFGISLFHTVLLVSLKLKIEDVCFREDITSIITVVIFTLSVAAFDIVSILFVYLIIYFPSFLRIFVRFQNEVKNFN